jgi:hypothetical protein
MRSKTWVADRRGAAFFRVLVFLIIFAGVVTAAWIFCLPPMVTSALQKKTGFTVKMTELVMNPFAVHVSLTGLVVTSDSAHFERTDFIDLRSFEADADLLSLFGERPVLERVKLDIAQLTFVRARNGTLNSTLFENRLNPPQDVSWPIETPSKPFPKEKPKTDPGPTRVELPPFLIKSLEVKLDKVVFIDYTTPEVTVREIPTQSDRTYENITDMKPISTLFAVHGGFMPIGSALKVLIPGRIGSLMQTVTRPRFQPAAPALGQPMPDLLKTLTGALEESRKP